MKDFSIDPVPSCHYILFSLTTTPRRVSNFCNSVKKFENRAKKLHTSATFWIHLCQKLAYCKTARARIISIVVPRETRMTALFVSYIRKFRLRLVWPHETVLQTSATDSEIRKVENYVYHRVLLLLLLFCCCCWYCCCCCCGGGGCRAYRLITTQSKI